MDARKESGGTSVAVTYYTKPGDIATNLDGMFSLVRSGLARARLSASTRNNLVSFSDTQSQALHCGADIIEALGVHALPYIDTLLNDMFAAGLSEDLIRCLHSIAACVPSKATMIEDRLMQELSLGLAGSSAVNEICDPLFKVRRGQRVLAGVGAVSVIGTARSRIHINMSESSDAVCKLVLSLRTLGSFGNRSRIFPDVLCGTLLPFVQNVVARYLVHPSTDVRREAALTCCMLLLPSNHCSDRNGTGRTSQAIQLGSASELLVEEVVQNLLRVAVSDPSPVVRHSVIFSFDRRYDSHLCQKPSEDSRD